MCAFPDLIEAGIAGDPNPIGANALLAQPLRIAGVDRANHRDGAIRVSEQRTGEGSAPAGGFGLNEIGVVGRAENKPAANAHGFGFVGGPRDSSPSGCPS